MAKLTLEAIKERSDQEWDELIDYYAISADRAERCAPQDLLDRRWLLAEVDRLGTRVEGDLHNNRDQGLK